ncbi:hypothetical protein [Mobiluncus mulieris]|uniref:hypothetical protein n=1 Tax=Mobiluncus mulieris TaxID=2052 RepID=UPI00201502DB|nr:hypothetical protein [Mobiluncus mulieris]
MASGSHLLTGAAVNHGGVPTADVDCQEPVRAGLNPFDPINHLLVVPTMKPKQALDDGVQVFFS